MAEQNQTFSESWYRVANQKISLHPGVVVQRQNFRGERWIVLQNPFRNQFFRIRPAAYEFLARLQPSRTVDEVWKECLERHPDETPGQEAVIQLLAQLYHANLLQYEVAGDTAQLFQRYERTRQRETRSRWLNWMFLRVPIFDPDTFLVRSLPIVGKLISPFGALLWLIMMIWGVKTVIDHFSALQSQTQSLLSPGNLPLLYVGLVLIKTLHEFGHAYFCRKFGGEVHVMGIMFLVFSPIPYMDATSSWGLRSRWQRVLVGAAGMIVELFVAAVAAVVWASTGPGVIHSLAYNMIFVASVSTLIFNINPLLRYDGYYILSDLLEIPNLHQRSTAQLKHWGERYLFGIKKSQGPARTRSGAVGYATFGLASGIYRILVFGGILLFISNRFFEVGFVLLAVGLVSWVGFPLIKFVGYLLNGPVLERTRWRAVSVAGGLTVLVLAILQFVPAPHSFRAPGIVQSNEWSDVMNESPGRMVKLLAKPGTQVAKGQPLMELSNPALKLDLSMARAQRDEIQARLRHAMQEQTANLEPLAAKLKAIQEKVDRLEFLVAGLTVRARQEGLWVATHVNDLVGRWFTRGSRFGLLLNPDAFEFKAIVAQEDAEHLFGQKVKSADVRFFGQSEKNLALGQLKVIPAEQQLLPSAALGWAGGGEVKTASDDPEGRRAAESFFEVRAPVRTDQNVALIHGRSGKMRFVLQNEPLLPRWTRRVRQVFLRRLST